MHMIATIRSDGQPIETARELESKRGALMTSGDADGLAEILSTDLYYAHSSGLLDDKQSFLAKFRNGVFVYHKVEARVEAAVSLGSDALQANGVLQLEVALNGVERRIQSVYLVVWRREEGMWCLVGHQTTLLPKN
jgi:hypothetical protein